MRLESKPAVPLCRRPEKTRRIDHRLGSEKTSTKISCRRLQAVHVHLSYHPENLPVSHEPDHHRCKTAHRGVIKRSGRQRHSHRRRRHKLRSESLPLCLHQSVSMFGYCRSLFLCLYGAPLVDIVAASAPPNSKGGRETI